MTREPEAQKRPVRNQSSLVKALHDPARYDRVWREHVTPLSGAYEMNP